MYALNQCWKIGKYTLGGQKSWMIIKLGIVYEIVWYKLVCSIPRDNEIPKTPALAVDLLHKGGGSR